MTSIDLAYFETLPHGTLVPVTLRFTSPGASARVTLHMVVRPECYYQGRVSHSGLDWSGHSRRWLTRTGLASALEELIPYCLHEGCDGEGSTDLDESGWECAWRIEVPDHARFTMPVIHHS
jgi:hypothetical protein